MKKSVFSKPKIIIENNTLKLTFPKQNIQLNNLSEENIFAIKPIKKEKNITKKSVRPVAPPLGDISVGTTYIPNLKTINLDGPNVSMISKALLLKVLSNFDF